MSTLAVSVKGISKGFDVYARPSDLAREILTGRSRHDTFWALRDVSFDILEKQRVGIIGANGSGKSTLLKIITGHLQPTAGTVHVNGSVSAMLSLTSALNPDETGIRNIRFNLILNGCPRSKIEQLTEEIVEFTELGSFIYSPVKTYSSGMNAKLAFAISTAIDPEILVVDEVLSVGDAYFMGKATRRMVDLCNRGKALLFVSHSTAAIQMLCDTVIWMDNGCVRMIGSVEHVIRCYEDDYRAREDEATRSRNRARRAARSSVADALELTSPRVCRLRVVPNRSDRVLHDTHYIRSIQLVDGAGIPKFVELALSDPRRQQEGIVLDVLDSEWGRLYEKAGSECRVLSAKSGKLRGGQLVAFAPASAQTEWAVGITIESCAILGTERLRMEYLDARDGKWAQASEPTESILAGGWTRARFDFHIPLVSEAQFTHALAIVHENEKPDVEIEEVTLTGRHGPTSTIMEQEPFVIQVRIRANRLVEGLDVGIKIIRSDGVYVFWQSSGLGGIRIDDLTGTATILFSFAENPFGAGSFACSAYIASEWDYPKNYPYSAVFDRKVDALRFTVLGRLQGVDFGVMNCRVPVSIERS